MMRLVILASALAFAAPALAQDHSGHAGHQPEGAEEKPAETKPKPAPLKLPTPQPTTVLQLPGAPPVQAPDPHAGHAGMDHSQMDHSAHGGPPPPEAPPPPRAFEGPASAADAIWGEEAMQRARAKNRATHGGMTTGMVMVERFEARVAEGHDAFLWDAQAWYGGDIDKLWFKTEGEGEVSGEVEDAEFQLLWSHAIGPFVDLQAGARLDVEPDTRAHLVLGAQGLAPYNIHFDAAAFLSDRGDLTARIEAEHDWKLTQRLILQPRAELELSAQDIPEREIAAGPAKFETGLRLRYEIAREFAPYIGIGYEAKLFETADIGRAAGEDPDGFALLLGIRAWF